MVSHPVPYTDEEVQGVSRMMDEGSQLGLFETVRCCFIGSRCKETHIVSVAVYPGMEGDPRATDLFANRYVDPENVPSSGFQRMEELGNCIRRYPYGAPREQPFHWTIFGVPHTPNRTIPSPRNERFDQLKCHDATKTVNGNLVIVKSLPCGTVQDVLERELFFVERLVYSFFEDSQVAYSDNYPILSNPLVTMDEGHRRWGWGSVW